MTIIHVDPIVLEVVEGALASAEAEVEAAVERTSRSPMIREARDFRAGIHDRRCRKLTGRSYSALVNPIVRDFPLATMRPGDVFFHNDVYQSEGGIGHLPDLCVTVPVFDGGDVVAFVQAFGHHEDSAAAVARLDASHATRRTRRAHRPAGQDSTTRADRTPTDQGHGAESRCPTRCGGDLDNEAWWGLPAGDSSASAISSVAYGRDPSRGACFDAILDRTTDTSGALPLEDPDGT